MDGERSFIDKLLGTMAGRGASDLFVCEGKPPALRVDGRVLRLKAPPTDRDAIDAFLADALSPGVRTRLEQEGDADFGYSLERGMRFRFNVARQKGGLALVARALPSGELGFEELGLPVILERMADEPRGLILVVGTAGSGKSTTMAAMVHRINTTRAAHIVTIEDPIEFVHRDHRGRVTQREVGADTASFHAALRHVVRQSPDTILIGEMRDLETMHVALGAALTGHQVLATLHTVDVSQTLQRILAYFPDHQRAQAALDLSLCLRGIVAQRLLPRADGGGRVVVSEVVTMSPPYARLLREQRVEEMRDLMRATDDPDVLTFDRALVQRLQAGEITYEVGRVYATNPEEFALAAQGMTIGGASGTSAGSFDVDGGLDMKALLTRTLDRSASDLHLTVGRPPIVRVQGELSALSAPPLSDGDMRALVHSILTVRQRTTYELDREIDFALALDDGRRFRVNLYYQRGHMAAALRTIPTRVPNSTSLRIPETVLQLGSRPHGLLVVVGPTGAGKTTTLACLVDRINHERSCRIVTIEDPIEYIHTGDRATVDQREVHSDTLSFAHALKFILRQDPDVIMIGEMRDLETISAALTAAETGHLVLATLHANDAIQAVDRIVDVFPSAQQGQMRAQLASSLLGVVSQRLLPAASGEGRVGAFEILVATTAVRAHIRDKKTHQTLALMESSQRDGMMTMDQALSALYQEKAITYEAALRFVRTRTVLGPPPDSPGEEAA